MMAASCWRRRSDADPEAFRKAVAEVCACRSSHAEVRRCRAYWKNDDTVVIEVEAESCYLTAPPTIDVARLVYNLVSLGEPTGTFRW